MATIVSLIRDSVATNSERRALAAQRGYRTESWRYRHLWEFSGRVSTYLRDQGIESGDRIVLKAPNSPRWVAAYLGCLRLGAIVVPLDVRSSEDFVSSVIEKTGPKLAFSNRLTVNHWTGCPSQRSNWTVSTALRPGFLKRMATLHPRVSQRSCSHPARPGGIEHEY